MEVWKKIKGFEYYYVSNLGNIKSKKFNKDKIMSKCYDSSKYHIVTLRKNKIKFTLKVHRLVANAFIENIFNKETVNHINGIKTDNRVENLEWATRKEQTIHSFKNSLQLKTTNRIILNIETGVYYNSVKEASKYLEYKESTLASKLNGTRKNNTNLIYC